MKCPISAWAPGNKKWLPEVKGGGAGTVQRAKFRCRRAEAGAGQWVRGPLSYLALWSVSQQASHTSRGRHQEPFCLPPHLLPRHTALDPMSVSSGPHLAILDLPACTELCCLHPNKVLSCSSVSATPLTGRLVRPKLALLRHKSSASHHLGDMVSEIWEGSELTSRNPSGREQGKSPNHLHLSENEFVRLTAQREWNPRSCVRVERSQRQDSPIWGIIGNGWKKALTQSLVRSGRASSEKVEGLPTS